VIGFSINTPAMIGLHEKDTATLEQRLSAIQQCEEMGFWVAIHFDPIFLYPEWKEDYCDVVGRIFSHIKDPQKIAWWSMGGSGQARRSRNISSGQTTICRFLHQAIWCLGKTENTGISGRSAMHSTAHCRKKSANMRRKQPCIYAWKALKCGKPQACLAGYPMGWCDILTREPRKCYHWINMEVGYNSIPFLYAEN